MRQIAILQNSPFCFLKKSSILLALLCFVNISAIGQNEFITTWKTDNEGVSNDQSIRIPTTGDGYNYDVDWDNDGNFDSLNVSGDITHEYDSAGIYTIRIRGDFPRIFFSGGGDRLKILSIDQWGTINWTSFAFAFRGAINLNINATDAPDLSGVTNMERMFLNADLVNSDISNWDVSNVTNMAGMFSGAESFNQDLGDWNISSVSNMTNMFNNSGMSIIQYDRTLTGWESQGVSGIPLGATGVGYCDSETARTSLINTYGWTITGDILDCSIHDHFVTTWKTDNPGPTNNYQIRIPTTGGGYNYDIDWDNDGHFDDLSVSGAITHTYPEIGTYTVRIRGAFPRIRFNNGGDRKKILSIEQWGNISWMSMENAFYGCINLVCYATDVPDLSNVTNLSNMFRGDTEILGSNFSGDLSDWDVSNVTNMSYMFFFASNFTSDLSNWNVSEVTNMSWMFFFASNFTSDLSNWNVSKVTNMDAMFASTSNFTSDLSNWDVSKVINMSSMFSSAVTFTSDLSNWNVSKVTNMSYMFNSAVTFNSDLSSWDVDSVTNMSNMFSYANNFTSDLSAWDVGSVTDMSYMFTGANSFNNDISSWDVSNVLNMRDMFEGATSFNSDLSSWDVGSVTNMLGMFENASSFNCDLSAWEIGSVIYLTHMLDNSGLSLENYDATLIGWKNQADTTNISLNLGSVQGLSYCNALEARDSLINVYGWSITGDILDCAPLPVELLDFGARELENEQVLLSWTTASEENNKGFELLRSRDGQRWETIGFVEGQGFSDVVADYEFTDRSPHTGLNYYRLRQLDFDGNFEYSEVVSVTIASDDIALKVFPNPAQDFLFLENISGQIDIFNALGQKVKTITHPKATATINISDLAEGQYFLTLSSGPENISSRRFVIQK